MLNYYKYSIKFLQLNIFLAIFTILLFIIVLIFRVEIIYDFHIFYLIYLLLWLMLHEAIHYIGYILHRDVHATDLLFGIELEKGIFYCICNHKVSRKTAIESLALPLIIIGIFTLVIGFIFDNSLLIVLSLFNISSSIGDIIMIILFLKLPKDVEFTYLNTCEAFYIISKKDISGVNVPCLEMVERGKYSDKKFNLKNNRFLSITKLSWILLIIAVVLCLVLPLLFL